MILPHWIHYSWIPNSSYKITMDVLIDHPIIHVQIPNMIPKTKWSNYQEKYFYLNICKYNADVVFAYGSTFPFDPG